MAHVPPLGFGVYQLLEGPSSETVLADYNLYHDAAKVVKLYKTFNVKEIKNALDEIMLENSYMKVWFSGNSGLLEVRWFNCFKRLDLGKKIKNNSLNNFFPFL